MKVNYNAISQVYDDVREADVDLINRFLQEVDGHPSARVLDIGCGTGNYTDLFQKVTQAQVYGIDPSEGMLDKARQKNSGIIFKQAGAEALPFEDGLFDFIYMTDVIHHVPDIDRMLAEIYRVLTLSGKLCIVTQSHQQIDKRAIVRFFPGTAIVDKQRYPDIDQIIETATSNRLASIKTETLFEDEPVELGEAFLQLVKKKGFSMLHLISEEEYRTGLMALEAALQKGKVMSRSAGETLVWFVKDELG